MLSRADSQVVLPSSTWLGIQTSIRSIPSEEQRLTPGGDTNAQLTIQASKIRRFCFLSFFFAKRLIKYFTVPFGRGQRRPISSKRANSCILFCTIPLGHWVPVRCREKVACFLSRPCFQSCSEYSPDSGASSLAQHHRDEGIQKENLEETRASNCHSQWGPYTE